MNKRILILGSFPAPYRVDVFKEICKVYDCDIIFAKDKDQNRSNEYYVSKNELGYYLLSDDKGYIFYKLCIKNIKQYSAVLAYDWYLSFAIIVEEKCIQHDIPYYINCDGAFIPEREGIMDQLKAIVKKRYIRKAQKCFASGKYARNYFKYYGAKDENIVEHCFTSLHREDILDEPVNPARKLTIKSDLKLNNRKMVLSIGQFIHRKGFDILIKAWKELDEKYQLVIIGGGEEKPLYEKIIKELNLKNVSLIDFLPKNIIKMYYQAADLFVLPTREDVWGLVINEAMANGLPIVASDKCIAALELIDNNGIIVPAENVESIVLAVKEILENQQLITSYSSVSCQLAHDHVVEDIGRSHLELIKRK